MDVCVHAAIHSARLSAERIFQLADEHDDALNAKKVAVLHEVLDRELPIRMPGVSFRFGEPSSYRHHSLYSYYSGKKDDENAEILIKVTIEWGEESK